MAYAELRKRKSAAVMESLEVNQVHLSKSKILAYSRRDSASSRYST